MNRRDSSNRYERGEGPKQRLVWWFLLKGNRLIISAGAAVVVFLLTLVLAHLDAIAIGGSSSMGSVASSAIAGLFTLITVTLTINQLILSRVFGTPQGLSDQLEGNRQFRQSVEDLTDRRSTPNEPSKFISLIGETLYERANSLQEMANDFEGEHQDFTGELSGIVTQADALRQIDSDETRVVEILRLFLVPRYAQSMTTVDRLQETYADHLPEDAQETLDTISRLLEAVAVTRQYYKTLALQQALAQLSRSIAYTGFFAILVAVYTALIYRSSGSPALAPEYLPWIASASIAIIMAPLAVLLAYVLRIATISRYTLSVGPFVPPKEQIGNE